MSTQAVISLAGKQFLVSEGDLVTIDKHLDLEPGKSLTVEEVLLTADGDDVKVGQPHLAGVKVTLEVISLKKSPKIVSARFQAKSRSRRKVGHRQPQTELKVTKIA